MKSGKQRSKKSKPKRAARIKELPVGTAPVNAALLAPYNSYGVPAFVERGYYVDIPFQCEGCGKLEIWSAAQQKWWYEVAKGYVYSTAKLCRSCRRREQAHRAEARHVHLEGVARKKSSSAGR